MLVPRFWFHHKYKYLDLVFAARKSDHFDSEETAVFAAANAFAVEGSDLGVGV